MAELSIADLSKGMTIKYEGDLYKVIRYEHSRQGRGNAFARTKIRNLKTGKVLSRTFKGSDKLQKAYMEQREIRFLYSSGENYHFMDEENYEQFRVPEEKLEEKTNYLIENLELTGLFHKGNLISVELPTFVELEVEDTRPGVKGDTASGGTKPATLSTGLTVDVPLFIDEGETIKVDTRSDEYIERV